MSDARFLRMIQVFFERQGIHLRYLNETMFGMTDIGTEGGASSRGTDVLPVCAYDGLQSQGR